MSLVRDFGAKHGASRGRAQAARVTEGRRPAVAGPAHSLPRAIGPDERLAHTLWIASNNGKIRSRGLIGCRAALLPIAQRADRNVISSRKVFLADPERAPNDFHLRRPLHAAKIGT